MVEPDHHENAGSTAQWRPGTGRFLGCRIVVDREGRPWTVREADATHVPGARAERCLIFDTSGYCFRVWQYPFDWRELTNGELLALGRVTCD